jgi:uncharacterized protein
MNTSRPNNSIDAGDFDQWLTETRASFKDGRGTSVPCGECRGCCVSSYFIHIKPQDARSLDVIPRHLLISVPRASDNAFLMGYDQEGRCPMLKNANCSIYADRPSTCKDYDCRIFAAAGILAGERDKSVINERIGAWQFRYSTEDSRFRHQAIREAARFILNNRDAFPGGRAPTAPTEIAIVAIKVYSVFLPPFRSCDPVQIAAAIIDASREFEATASLRSGRSFDGDVDKTPRSALP